MCEHSGFRLNGSMAFYEVGQAAPWATALLAAWACVRAVPFSCDSGLVLPVRLLVAEEDGCAHGEQQRHHQGFDGHLSTQTKA